MRMTNPQDLITVSIVGAGSRAGAYINALEANYHGKFKVVAVAEPRAERRKYFQEKYQIPDSMIFGGYEEFIKQPRLSDIVIIATLDDMHYIPTIDAIKKGYDIILEKPIAMTVEETVAIGEYGAKHPNQLIAICHVLRHSPFFRKIKEIIDSKELGNVIDIQHNENVGYYHFAHSYVRGNWRNTKISAPFIVAKSCHDLDILLYLLGDKHCQRIASLGSLTFFNHDNYSPDIMAPRCADCSIEKDCPYSALKIYSSGKIRSVVFDTSTEETLRKELATSNYGRCVFACDNDVPDHQVTILEFEKGVHATFNLSAFTDKIHRSIKVMCEYGEIRGIETTKEIEITHFGTNEKRIITPQMLAGGHGGADTGFIINYMETYLNNKPFDSTLAMSIESHVMAFAAEESRLQNGKMIDVAKYHQSIKDKTEGRKIG
ncbi:MAG TPA: Gfo/Idh/MocA family oxidoreductase [Bacilli bacterium]|nr:Gfo/Idh/MocA family oxidoreductase [Bacilli bacterium]